MIYLTLAIEFFKIGLFSIGGGLATIPFLSELGIKYGWYTQKELVDMIAISESTPGPIGINMGTYVGFKTAGVTGAIVATLFEVLPAIIVITIIAKTLSKFKNNNSFQKIMNGIRPCTFALIVAAFINVFSNSVLPINQINNLELFKAGFDIRLILMFIGIFAFKKYTKFHPLIYIFISAILGIIIF